MIVKIYSMEKQDEFIIIIYSILYNTGSATVVSTTNPTWKKEQIKPIRFFKEYFFNEKHPKYAL